MRGTWEEIEVEDALISANAGRGVAVYDATLSITRTEISDNPQALFAERARVECAQCRLSREQAIGPPALVVAHYSTLLFHHSDLVNTLGPALVAEDHSTVELTESLVNGSSEALDLLRYSRVEMADSEIVGSIHASDHSSVRLIHVDQKADSGNFFVQDSSVFTSFSKLVSSSLHHFSRGTFGSSTELGTLSCDSGSNASCNISTSFDSSSCSLCQ